MIQSRYNTLCRLGSAEEFPSYAEVRKLLDKVDYGHKEAYMEMVCLKHVINDMEVSMHSQLGMWADAMDDINTYAKEAFKGNTIQIGRASCRERV